MNQNNESLHLHQPNNQPLIWAYQKRINTNNNKNKVNQPGISNRNHDEDFTKRIQLWR